MPLDYSLNVIVLFAYTIIIILLFTLLSCPYDFLFFLTILFSGSLASRCFSALSLGSFSIKSLAGCSVNDDEEEGVTTLSTGPDNDNDNDEDGDEEDDEENEEDEGGGRTKLSTGFCKACEFYEN